MTKLVKLRNKDSGGKPIILNPNGAENLGVFLQLVNITQNVREDWDEGGRAYFPAMLRSTDVSHEFMVEGPIAEVGGVRRKSLNDMLELAKDRFKKSAAYVSSIPDLLRGYKTFSGMLLISGREIVKVMEKEGAEAVFEGCERSIRLSDQTLANISAFSQLVTRQPERLNPWLAEYAANPDKFVFHNGEFRDWVQEYTH